MNPPATELILLCRSVGAAHDSREMELTIKSIDFPGYVNITCNVTCAGSHVIYVFNDINNIMEQIGKPLGYSCINSHTEMRG